MPIVSVPSQRELQSLVDLVSNTTDAYTTVLFLAPAPGQDLYIAAYQSLSRNIDTQVLIGPGEGLIGWVYKNDQPVNVDKFDRDTRRLLFYKEDESIKSFMAVPLPGLPGVLAVDSKQRYVFTEKNQKILNQFGQAIELVIKRGEQADRVAGLEKAMDFMAGLEQALGVSRNPSQYMPPAMSMLRQYTAARACFCTAVLHNDPNRYFVMSHNSEANMTLSQDLFSVNSGLAGWVIHNKKKLIPERPLALSEKSFIFYPDEPLKRLMGFAGFPLLFGAKVRGALILAHEDPFRFDPTVLRALELCSKRLAASLEMEFLFQRMAELNHLDAQVGLPHRTHFIERLSRMIKRAAGKGALLTLLVISIDNLSEAAAEVGQEEVLEILRGATRHLLVECSEENELGHLSYGIIGVAFNGEVEVEARSVAADLTEMLAEQPLASSGGRIRLKTRTALVRYPREAKTAEGLIMTGLAKLNQ
jgi:GAF domain-containing protein